MSNYHKGKEEFIEAGGTEFYAVPCINDNDDWVALIAKWINEWAKSAETVIA